LPQISGRAPAPVDVADKAATEEKLAGAFALLTGFLKRNSRINPERQSASASGVPENPTAEKRG
jgi:hypothetical protein